MANAEGSFFQAEMQGCSMFDIKKVHQIMAANEER